jgi:hypothetical protein
MNKVKLLLSLSLLFISSAHAIDVYRNIVIINNTSYTVEKKGWTLEPQMQKTISVPSQESIVLTVQQGNFEGTVQLKLQLNVGGTFRLMKIRPSANLANKITVQAGRPRRLIMRNVFGKTIYKTFPITISEKPKR